MIHLHRRATRQQSLRFCTAWETTSTLRGPTIYRITIRLPSSQKNPMLYTMSRTPPSRYRQEIKVTIESLGFPVTVHDAPVCRATTEAT